ncbi:MAG: hypothetical protein GY869_21000 [Planctomycetes bacterium]|nr:hypothetical protein [Planctomycetota bacterium]
MIIYVSKEKLFPAFGYAWPEKGIAWVRVDLPQSVADFVEVHEKYHLKDKAVWWVWREVKANIAGAVKHPVGFARCVWMSVASIDRWRFYIKRTRAGK